MWIEIVYPKNLLSEKGVIITEEHLKEILANFESDRRAYEERGAEYPGIPITFGHPRDRTTVAIGWVRELKLKDGGLWGRIEASDILQTWLDKGILPKSGWSAGLIRTSRGMELNHVAALPGNQPVLPGLRALSVAFLSHEPAEIFYFSRVPSLQNLPIASRSMPWDVDGAKARVFEAYGWEGLAEYALYIDENEAKTKDPDTGLPASKSAYKFLVVDIVGGSPHIIPKAVSAGLAILHGGRGGVSERIRKTVEPKLKTLKARIDKEVNMSKDKQDSQTQAQNTSPENQVNLSKEDRKEGNQPETQVQTHASHQQNSIDEKRLELQKRLLEQEDRIHRLEFEMRKAEIKQYVDHLVGARKVLPSWRDDIVKILLALEANPVRIELSYENGRNETIDVAEALRQLFEKFPEIVPRVNLSNFGQKPDLNNAVESFIKRNYGG